jgi:hypothetical protein
MLDITSTVYGGRVFFYLFFRQMNIKNARSNSSSNTVATTVAAVVTCNVTSA